MAEVEKLASLIAGTILTYHDNLLEAYNQNPAYKTEYNAANVGTTHLLNRILFLEGNHENEPSLLKFRLKFKVAGQIQAAPEIVESFGILEKIHSPGLICDQSIDININVE